MVVRGQYRPQAHNHLLVDGATRCLIDARRPKARRVAQRRWRLAPSQMSPCSKCQCTNATDLLRLPEQRSGRYRCHRPL